MNVFVIDTGYFKLDGGAMFGVVPKSIWNKSNPADENNLCTWAMRCLLVEDGNQLTLIDTGIGTKQDPSFFKYYYLHGEASLVDSIQKAGFSTDEITDVFLTHLHFDHCGGATVYNADRSKIDPLFSKARYWTNQAHWDWAVKPNPREKASFLKENLLPLEQSGQLNFLNSSAFSPSIDVILVDGHTEKQMLPVINFNSKKIIYLADLIPSSSHVKPPYIMSYDVRPLQTMEEKERVLALAADNDYILFFEHDPVTEAAKVVRTEKGFELTTGRLSDFL